MASDLSTATGRGWRSPACTLTEGGAITELTRRSISRGLTTYSSKHKKNSIRYKHMPNNYCNGSRIINSAMSNHKESYDDATEFRPAIMLDSSRDAFCSKISLRPNVPPQMLTTVKLLGRTSPDNEKSVSPPPPRHCFSEGER